MNNSICKKRKHIIYSEQYLATKIFHGKVLTGEGKCEMNRCVNGEGFMGWLTAEKKGKAKNISKVTVKYDVGFKNFLYIRGSGAGLSWEKGKMLRNTGADEWVWETDEPFQSCEFKVLINDHRYEGGANHHLPSGATVKYTPVFNA